MPIEVSAKVLEGITAAISFLSDVAHGGTRLVLTIDEKPLGCVVSMEDFHRLQENDEQKGKQT
jgi:hypothetical protein